MYVISEYENQSSRKKEENRRRVEKKDCLYYDVTTGRGAQPELFEWFSNS